jgi:hypothetical protein
VVASHWDTVAAPTTAASDATTEECGDGCSNSCKLAHNIATASDAAR